MAPTKIRAVATSLVLIGAASLSAIAATAPAQADDAATAPVAVSISKKRVVTLPATIQPGVSQFHITTAAKESGFQVALPAAGYTIEQAVNDIDKGLEQGKIKPPKRFEANVTLLGGATATPDVPGTLWVTLAAGSYWAVDINANKEEAFTPFTVAGLDTGNVMPASAKVKAVDSTKWSKKPKSIPNKGLLTFQNSADQNHFLDMVKLKKGKTLQDFEDWFLTEGPPQGPPPVDFSKFLTSGVVSPGHSETFNYKLPKGNYIMLCFWPDASMGGMPHAFMGMYREIKLK
jgi:hypothetical protein